MAKSSAKARMKGTPDQLCAFCNVRQATTRGHVPARALFPKPRPDDLITVPACHLCNNGASKDEDFFLATILFTDAGTTEVGKKVWRQTQNKAYSKNFGLRRAISRRLTPVHVFTPRELWAGQRFAVELDHDRLTNVVRTVVRGLFRFETGTNLEESTYIDAAPLFTQSAIAKVEGLTKYVSDGVRNWPGIFEYRRGISPEVHQGSIWLIRFLGTICYWALTVPEDMASAHDAG